MTHATILKSAQWFLRVGLAAGFLSAVADRFGMWGVPGAPNVAWGEFGAFVDYVAVLNWFVPASVIPALAWTATLAETLCALGLLVGRGLRWFALASGLLLSSFATTMTIALGIKTALDYSVFAAAGGAFVLVAISLASNDQTRRRDESERTAVQQSFSGESS